MSVIPDHFSKDPLKWLIIPIETKVREFDAKLLLGCTAAESGYGVILGHQHAIKKNWHKMPRGIFFDKSVVKSNEKKFFEYKKRGHRVVAWCEEGLLLADEQDYLNRKIYPATMEIIDLFFAWGSNQERVVSRKVPNIRERLKKVGNPRIDLLRKEVREYCRQQVDELKSRHAPFLLVNTNFAAYNNIRGTETSVEIQKKSGKIRTPEDENLFREFIAFKKDMYHAFISMIEELANTFPDYTVVVRPHPAENHTTWRSVADRYSNIRVIHEGNVVNWIMAAELTIQNGCTTGIESYILEKPTISYQPFQAPVYEDYLPDILGKKAANLEELFTIIREVLSGKPFWSDNARESKNSYAARYIENINGSLCVDLIMHHLEGVNIKKDRLVGNVLLQSVRNMRNAITAFRYFLRNLKDHIVSGEHLALRTKSQESLASVQKKILKQVFPGLSLEEVEEGITNFQNATGRYSGIQVHQFCKNCFALRMGNNPILKNE